MDHQLLDTSSEGPPSQRGSRPTSPGGCWSELKNTKVIEVSGSRDVNGSLETDQTDDYDANGLQEPSRYRPRTFPYRRYLPYRHNDRQIDHLRVCIKRLYVAVSAGDFIPGATHWTREIRGWMQLKFDLPRALRIKLVKLYYELALAPGMESSAAERFSGMFMALTKYDRHSFWDFPLLMTEPFRRKAYLRPGNDLYLDWRPLLREFQSLVLPSDKSSMVTVNGGHPHKSTRTLVKLCTFAQVYFNPAEIPAMFEAILPFFSTSNPENGFAVIALLNLLLPTTPAARDSKWQPQDFIPSLFHMGALLSRSKILDNSFLDLYSRLARDGVVCDNVDFTPWGIFTGEQASMIFTAILRLLEIPVSQVTSPYSPAVDGFQGLAGVLERDHRKQPTPHHIARWIVMSLSPACEMELDSMLSKLEGLMQAVETFFHPSNTGSWTKNLSQLVFYLADFFVMRWNRERSGEMAVPKERKLSDSIKRRFVLCLREVTFLGIYAKSGTAISYSMSSLQSLAFLEPKLILPGALQRIYPSMTGLEEVHRTISSIRALHELTGIIARTKGYRCHLMTLLRLSLPGIDANDLDKTMHTLSFMQGVFYQVPVVDLTASSQNSAADDMEIDDTDPLLAEQWVSNQIERLDAEGVNVEIDYDVELSDIDETRIIRSSSVQFKHFIESFLDSIFEMLRNLPDASRVKSGSPEENIANSLPATFTPFFSTMSPDLYDLALSKISNFVSNHVVYQARDATAFICSSLCNVDPKKAMNVLIPILSKNIRSEIDNTGAGSKRTTGSEILPRDKALVWNISLLSMSLVHVGSALVEHGDALIDIARYVQQKCRGIPSTHASNLIHHILLTLTMTYTVDYSLYEEADLANGITAAHWGKGADPWRLNIKWHYADDKEIDLAVRMFQEFAQIGLRRLEELTSDESPIKRDGSGKEWSDELSRFLVLLRLMLSGISALFDPRIDIGDAPDTIPRIDGAAIDNDAISGDEEPDASADAEIGATEDEDVKPTFQYPTGYHLIPGDPNYVLLHRLRTEIGEKLHRVHQFLCEKQQDDVTAFNALYTAYRSWFTDVGFERSAHVLDRVTRLFVADINPFKISGLRKGYPRPLLVRRANVYHLQRLRHNASPRHKTDLDVTLLQDLVQSSVSLYTEIRRTAQTAIESTMKVMIGARPVIIPPLLKHLETAIRDSDFPRIKGSMYSLLFGSLTKPVARDWRFTPSLLKSWVSVMDVDKPSIQKIATVSAIQVMDMTRQTSRMVIIERSAVDEVAPEGDEVREKLQRMISKRKKIIQERFDFTRKRRVEVASELVLVAQKSHWKKESRTSTIVIGLSLRFEDITSPEMAELVVQKAIDSHPSLRSLYSNAFLGLLTYIDMRALANHSYENLLREKQHVPSFFKLKPDRDNPQWTGKFLGGFAQADAQSYVDLDYPGWLVWGAYAPAFDASASSLPEYDDTERSVQTRIGRYMDRKWFSTYFGYLKQEPRDSSSDRFRMQNVIGLTNIFTLVFHETTGVNFDDIKKLISDVFGDGSDKHQHRATAEILAGLLNASVPLDPSQREEVWSFGFPIVRRIFEEGITPENSSYWATFLDVVLQNKDPRRCWPLVEWLASFRLDMTSNAAFKESSKIQLLEHCILDLGWHFRLGKPIVDDFIGHLDHPYKGVREVMGQTLACLYRIDYAESHKDVQSFVENEHAASSIGRRPYIPSKEFENTVLSVFDKLETWRKERSPGDQRASSYTSGSKTVLAWLEHTLISFECTQLISFFPDTFIEALLHMMDIKEDPELQAHAYSVFRHLGNIPYRANEEKDFVDACIRVGRHASSWHQRLRIMINIQAIYFRQLFLMPRERQLQLFDCVTAMLEDQQHEVRVGAGATLSGMVRCSPVSLRDTVIKNLVKKFTNMLDTNRLPPRSSDASRADNGKIINTRHAAVLGLGGLVQAFPYASPPPDWVAGVLSTLAACAAGNTGVDGHGAKGIVSEFKKTRQDTWHIDKKVRTLHFTCIITAC